MGSRADTLPRQRTAARKKSTRPAGAAWMLLVPLVAGLVAAYFAVRYAEVLPLMGPAGLLRLRLMVPLAMLAHQPQLGIPEATADTVAQALMYAQFPIYGLMLGLLWRTAGFLRAASTVILVHAFAVGAVMIFSQL